MRQSEERRLERRLERSDSQSNIPPTYPTHTTNNPSCARVSLLAAHGNSVRGLIKMIDGIGDKDIQDVAVPTGIPIIYKFDLNLNPIHDADETNSDLNMTGAFEGIVAKNVRGLFLEKPGLLREALQREQVRSDKKRSGERSESSRPPITITNNPSTRRFAPRPFPRRNGRTTFQDTTLPNLTLFVRRSRPCPTLSDHSSNWKRNETSTIPPSPSPPPPPQPPPQLLPPPTI